MKYPFVGYRDAYYDVDDDEGIDGYSHDREFHEYKMEMRERCAACHRAEFANVSDMYLAGEGYDSNGVSTVTTHMLNHSSIRAFLHPAARPSIDPLSNGGRLANRLPPFHPFVRFSMRSFIHPFFQSCHVVINSCIRTSIDTFFGSSVHE